MNKVLFQPEVAEREYGSDLLSVPELLAWLKSKRLHLQTEPPFAEFDFVQVEALLCAIERPFYSMTDEQALSVIANDKRVTADVRLTRAPRWVLASNGHLAWRKVLDAAISAGELVPLDFASKLPVRPVVAKPEPVQDNKPLPHWKLRVQAEASAMFKRVRKQGAQPTVYNIVDALARWCRENDVRTSSGIFPSARYLRVHVLGGKHWKPPE